MSCDKENIKKFVAKKYIINSLKSLCMWHRNINNVRNFVHNLYLKNLFIDSKSAKILLRETGIDSCRKAKYILPLVLDTWNITKENGFKDVEIKTFNKPKPDINDTIDKVRLRYHKHLVYNLVINDESLFGNFSPDNKSTSQYECY